jgi:transglutaminase-like putative cysteine protease
MRLKLFSLLFLYFSTFFAQKIEYPSLLIVNNLKENANSIIRFQEINVAIVSQKLQNVTTKKVITVFNNAGISNVDAREYYSKSNKIKSIEARVYNALGLEIKKISKSDFKDQSVFDGFSILSDNRILFMDYTPTEYPFTIVYKCEEETTNTAFIPSWNPVDDFYESVEKSKFTITYPSDLGFKYKEFNFDGRNIKKEVGENMITFTVENIPAEKKEDYAPGVKKIWPRVLFGLEKFNLEGVEGVAKTWKEFGAWIYEKLLSDTEEIPTETVLKIKSLTEKETDPLEKAKIVYKYVQDKTRYVSVQLGIGGWKPMKAKDVDRLGYGDCKALSNYTRSLLKSIGIDANYTVIFAGDDQNNIHEDFVSMQGNHAILDLPKEGKHTFLECTNQSIPFGFGGNFTDDRYALLVKPEGGEIIKTTAYTEKTNSQITRGNYSIDADGNIVGKVQIKSKGIKYDEKYMIEKKSNDDIKEYYKNYFDAINNLKIEKSKFNNNKETIEFTEDIELRANSYCSTMNTNYMFALNAFNQKNEIPQRYRNRKTTFEVQRGYYDEDDIEITIPDGYTVNAKPDNHDFEDQFGIYKMEVNSINSQKIQYKRSILIKKGNYNREQYEEFRSFWEKIARLENSKIIIEKK